MRLTATRPPSPPPPPCVHGQVRIWGEKATDRTENCRELAKADVVLTVSDGEGEGVEVGGRGGGGGT